MQKFQQKIVWQDTCFENERVRNLNCNERGSFLKSD